MQFPENYGAIPNTLGTDNDAMDAMILFEQPIHPGVFVECTIVGAIVLYCEDGINENILCVPTCQGYESAQALMGLLDKDTSYRNRRIHFF